MRPHPSNGELDGWLGAARRVHDLLSFSHANDAELP